MCPPVLLLNICCNFVAYVRRPSGDNGSNRGVEKMLKENLPTAVGPSLLIRRGIKCGAVDTTVWEKAIDSPTDAGLYEKASSVVVCETQKTSVKLRQSDMRVFDTPTVRSGGILASPRTAYRCRS